MNARTDPELFGFAGGNNFRDGSVQYVGFGSASGCDSMRACPGFMSTKDGSAGCYMPCQATRNEIFDATNAYYLAWWEL